MLQAIKCADMGSEPIIKPDEDEVDEETLCAASRQFDAMFSAKTPDNISEVYSPISDVTDDYQDGNEMNETEVAITNVADTETVSVGCNTTVITYSDNSVELVLGEKSDDPDKYFNHNTPESGIEVDTQEYNDDIEYVEEINAPVDVIVVEDSEPIIVNNQQPLVHIIVK